MSKHTIYTNAYDHGDVKPQSHRPIITESASDFYSLLESTCADEQSTEERYSILRNVFHRAIEQSIAYCPIAFVGPFAKLDFCIKRYHIDSSTADLLQMARKELWPSRTQIEPFTEDYLAESFPHNLKATALLVCHLCGKVAIPESLRQFFPKTDRKRTWGKFVSKSTRAVVNRWDDSYIWVTADEDYRELKVCYSKENNMLTHDGKADWSYLNDILWEGAQLNLVRLRHSEEKDAWMPELIILEPDYLVNITTIASCFESYAESPFVNIINKIRPQDSAMPMHLGILAGQMLDDTVHGRERSVNESLKDYARSNALSMMACKEMRKKIFYENFKNDARTQKQNIQRLIGENLPQIVTGYDKKNVTLEPSFFSDTLGIQGRMDFLHEENGNAVIIEQKSGKGEFVPNTDIDTPVMKEQHHLQLLLYRALFRYEFNKYAGQLKHVMLLYSRYAKGLLIAPQAPELLMRAFKMRNLIAWTEIRYAKEEKGLDFLKTLTPEKLNKKHANGTLWEMYTRPQLKYLLDPIAHASELELAYYLRFMRFIENEMLLSKVGNKTKDNSGFAAIWHDTLEEKRAAGNIYDGLEIAALGSDESGINSVTLKLKQDFSADSTNFRPGDIVLLYPYKKEHIPDACAQMVSRGTIEDIREDSIIVKLRNSQTDAQVFDRHKGEFWAIEHDLYDSSDNALLRAMHSFLSATQSRRDLLLLQREPRVDTSLTIKGEYRNFNTLVTRAKQARDLFLIIGPPGTGKTSYGLVNLLKEELMEEGTNILLVSYTNRAVDEICSKLVEMREEDPSFNFIRIGSYYSCSDEYRRYLINENNLRSDKPGQELKRLIDNTRVFCATTSSINGNKSIFSLKHFSLAIVDEASQIIEPHLVGLFSTHRDGHEDIDRFVLIGDHKQLPAVVQQIEEESAVTEDMLRDIQLTDCRDSLFERLLRHFKTDNGYDERFVYMLAKQGRMHQEIAEFPNRFFYGGKLDVVPLVHQLQPLPDICADNGIMKMLITHRIAFIAAKSPHSSPSPQTNIIEAKMIAATVYQAYRLCLLTGKTFHKEKAVGVIVPYRNQISAVRNAIDQFGIPVLHDITIDTVERYQGSQRDCIVYGFTIQQRHQLNFLTSNTFEEDGMMIDRKLNVAMTRARLNLVMIGNPALLSQNVLFSELMEFIRSKGGYYSSMPVN